MSKVQYYIELFAYYFFSKSETHLKNTRALGWPVGHMEITWNRYYCISLEKYIYILVYLWNIDIFCKKTTPWNAFVLSADVFVCQFCPFNVGGISYTLFHQQIFSVCHFNLIYSINFCQFSHVQISQFTQTFIDWHIHSTTFIWRDSAESCQSATTEIGLPIDGIDWWYAGTFRQLWQ